MTRRTQRDRVFQLMFERGENGITRADAAVEIGCYELSSRIGELEAEGANIQKIPGSGKNRYGDTVRFTRYVLVSSPAALANRALGLSVEQILSRLSPQETSAS